MSKSAEVTPAATPFWTEAREREDSFFGVSRERERERVYEEDSQPVTVGRRIRKLSAGRSSLPMLPPSSGHVVDAFASHPHPRTLPHPHTHAAWGHPYQAAHRAHAVTAPVAGAHAPVSHEDSPSPMSSDSDSFQATQSPVSGAHAPHQPVPSHPTTLVGTKQDYAQHPPAYTPSTSPFLGGLRTLNIHSGAPSRAPSPFRLPPATLSASEYSHPVIHTHSPTEEHVYPYAHHQYPGRSSAPGSPPLSGRMAKRGSSGDLVAFGHGTYHHHPYHPHGHGSAHGYAHSHGYAYGRENEYTIQRSASSTSVFSMPGTYSHERDRGAERERTLAPLPTPQLSSGPSSSGSSPRSYSHQLVAGAESVESSRAPSPARMTVPGSSYAGSTSPHQAPAQAHGSGRDHHHHLAHSVRMAFGMTPIHPRASAPTSRPHASSTSSHPYPHTSHAYSHSHSHSLSHPFASHAGGVLTSASMPASRSSSPPIKLPPLKLPSSPSSPTKISALLAPMTVPSSTPASASVAPTSANTHQKSDDEAMDVEKKEEALPDIQMASADGQGEKRMKVELPGFSELTAATGLSALVNSASGAEHAA